MERTAVALGDFSGRAASLAAVEPLFEYAGGLGVVGTGVDTISKSPSESESESSILFIKPIPIPVVEYADARLSSLESDRYWS